MKTSNILEFRNIFGRKTNVDFPYSNQNANSKSIKGALDELFEKIADAEEVTPVDELPEIGEEGKIYYNSTDNKYYVVDNGEYIEFGAKPVIPVLAPSSHHLDDNRGFDIYPDTLYLLGTISEVVDATDNTTVTNVLNLYLQDTSTEIAQCYMGRFTVDAENCDPALTVNLYSSTNAYVASDTTFEDGHTYEFNIFHNVCVFMDITNTNAPAAEEATA